MIIGVQDQITTQVVQQKGSLQSEPKTFCLTGIISYPGGVEWVLPFFLTGDTRRVILVEQRVAAAVSQRQ